MLESTRIDQILATIGAVEYAETVYPGPFQQEAQQDL
jgi:hypothetical protein